MTAQLTEIRIFPAHGSDALQDHEPSMAGWCGPYRDDGAPRLIVHWVDGVVDAVHAVRPITETRQ